MAYKAAVRSGSLKTLAGGKASITAAEKHAKRLDPVAQKRRVRATDPIAWAKGDDGPLDYVAAYKAHKHETKAHERKNAALAMEMKLIVSPSWLAEDGRDPRDPNNERVQEVVEQAKAWAESWGGNGAVWAVRYDTDERGAGVVDVFMSPTREQRHKNGKSKLVISTRKAKAELLDAEKALDPELRTSGAAMQSGWARWCQQHLDPSLERGKPKIETAREHVHADVYAAEAEEARRKAAVELREALRLTREAEERLAPLRAAVKALEAHEAETKARKDEIRNEELLQELKTMCSQRAFHDPLMEAALWTVMVPGKANKARDAAGVTETDGPRAAWTKVRDAKEGAAALVLDEYRQKCPEGDPRSIKRLIPEIRSANTLRRLLNRSDFAQQIGRWVQARIEEIIQRPLSQEAKFAQELSEGLRQSLRDTAQSSDLERRTPY